MPSSEIQIRETRRRLPFATPTPGTQEVAELCRAGILRYLVPTSVGLALTYQVLCLAYAVPVSPFSLGLLAMCGIAYALKRMGRTSAAVATFTITSYWTLVLYSFPILGQDNGLSTGASYTLSLFPLMVWVCYAHRGKRLFALATTFAALAAIYAAGQPEEAAVALPRATYTLALIRCCFAVCVMMGIARVYDISVGRLSARHREALDEQRVLNLQLSNQQRDLEREASAHHATLSHLSRSESRYRHLFNGAFDGIVIYDSEREAPVEINPAMCKRLGYTASELLVLGPLDVSPERQADGRLSREVRAGLTARLDAGETVTYPWRHLTKTGAVVDYEVHTFCLPVDAHIRVSVFRDVTERMQAEAQLEAANRELRTFAHAASHDLKEPLRTMSNFAKLLGRRYADVVDDAGREYIGFILDAAQRGTTLVHDLLEYAEVGTGEVATGPVDLNHVAATVRQTVSARLEEEGARLVIGDLPTVTATQTWAQQLLQNLVSNALKFQRPGVPPVVRVSAETNALGHTIRVADNGIGIAPENLERVFGVFERLVGRQDYEGNGIGLALCRRIVGKLGGDIRVESVLGEGATFVLWFPDDSLIATGEVSAAADSATALPSPA